MKITLKFVAIAAALMTSFNSFASEPKSIRVAGVIAVDTSTFTIGAQIRPRFEYRHGFKKPFIDGATPAAFVEQRSRVWFDYRTKKFRMHLNLQDVRMWGSTDQIYKTDQSSIFNAFEAYGEYYLNDKWALKIGRQAIVYNNERFFGGLDWAQQGRSHDALLVKYNNRAKKLKIEAGGGFNSDASEPSFLAYEKYNKNNNKSMAFIWADKKWDKFAISVLIHNDGREKQDTLIAYRQTFAVIPSFSVSKNLKIDAEAYLQTGENGAGQNVNAQFFSLSATYKTSLTPLTLGVDYASGTQHDADDNTDNSWNPLYGTNHKFYGFMDYFYVGNGHGQASGRASGLTDIFLKTKFTLGKKKKSNLLGHVHYFMSPVELIDLTDPTKTVSSTLGTEIDLVYVYKLTKGVTAKLGYSHMFDTESMKHIKAMPNANTGVNNWAWASINFSSDIFKHKKQ